MREIHISQVTGNPYLWTGPSRISQMSPDFNNPDEWDEIRWEDMTRQEQNAYKHLYPVV